MLEQESARRGAVVMLSVQIVYVVSLFFVMLELKHTGNLPEYLTGLPVGISEGFYPLVALILLLKGDKAEHVRVLLYGVVFINLATVTGYWVMHNVFGGSATPSVLISFLVIPSIFILLFVRDMEFEQESYEMDQFMRLEMEIEEHTSIEEGMECVANHIRKHSDEFDDEYYIRFLEYLSKRDDMIGSVARSRLRVEHIDGASKSGQVL